MRDYDLIDKLQRLYPGAKIDAGLVHGRRLSGPLEPSPEPDHWEARITWPEIRLFGDSADEIVQKAVDRLLTAPAAPAA